MNRRKPALNAFAITFEGRLLPAANDMNANPGTPISGQSRARERLGRVSRLYLPEAPLQLAEARRVSGRHRQLISSKILSVTTGVVRA